MHSAIEFPQFWEEKHFSLKELYLTRAPGENDSSDNVGKRFPSLVFNLQIKEARLEKTRKKYALQCGNLVSSLPGNLSA